MPIRRLAALAVLTAVLAVQPALADVIVVGPEQRASIGLTVYSQESLALVRDVRHVTLPAGESVLRFTGVPAQLDPRTLALKAEKGAPALRVHEQTFRYDLAGSDTLTTSGTRCPEPRRVSCTEVCSAMTMPANSAAIPTSGRADSARLPS